MPQPPQGWKVAEPASYKLVLVLPISGAVIDLAEIDLTPREVLYDIGKFLCPRRVTQQNLCDTYPEHYSDIEIAKRERNEVP